MDEAYYNDLKRTYADAYERGYNRGFISGIRLLAEIYADTALMKKFNVEMKFEKEADE
jgi:hypothetical protein